MSEQRLLSYHRFTREHGVNWPMYVIARGILQPAFLIYLRLTRIGREHARVKGPLIVASNHRSFLDPFVIAASLPWRRPLHYVAKVELFQPRWQGWLLNRLGAYPVRRGQSDDETLITSRQVLERGGAICIFPEGTRIRTGSLGRPKRGFGRLALETGAAVLPVAVFGADQVRSVAMQPIEMRRIDRVLHGLEPVAIVNLVLFDPSFAVLPGQHVPAGQ